jgi:[ribosomal protein S5]-alanine N-acetyltransferase
MGPAVLEALLADDRVAAGRLLDCVIPAEMSTRRMPLAIRLAQIRQDLASQPWLLRAIVIRESGVMVGHINFHSPPQPGCQTGTAPEGVELGYTIHEPHRRRGYATEAALAMMQWAYSQHGQRFFLLSISPQNLASTAMAETLGFVQCGSHIDDVDGLEIEFVRKLEAWPEDWRAKMSKASE